jgi:hypothetical protein
MKYLKIFEEYNDQLDYSKYQNKIEELKKYEGESFFPLGKLHKVSYSNLGQTLILRLTGDVPTNFKEANLVIVHPDSDRGGWVGVGNIGLVIQASGALIEFITLPEETVELIKQIYREYTDTPCNIRFKTGVNITRGKDVTQFAQPGFYQKEIEDAKRYIK